jgi:DNA-binding MarR family transcriptional regulator
MTSPTELDAVPDLAENLRVAILGLSRHLRRDSLQMGLSTLEIHLLALIERAPGIGVSELAAHEQMSRPAMSVHIKRLEAEGLLERSSVGEDGDRRRAPLLLSRRGTEALRVVRQSRTDWLARRFDRLSAEDRKTLEAAIAPLMRLAAMTS